MKVTCKPALPGHSNDPFTLKAKTSRSWLLLTVGNGMRSH